MTFGLFNVSPTQALVETSSPPAHAGSRFVSPEHTMRTLIHSALPHPPVLLQLKEVTVSFPGQLSARICQLVRSGFSESLFSLFCQRRMLKHHLLGELYERKMSSSQWAKKNNNLLSAWFSIFKKGQNFPLMMHCTLKEGGCTTQKERHFQT